MPSPTVTPPATSARPPDRAPTGPAEAGPTGGEGTGRRPRSRRRVTATVVAALVLAVAVSFAFGRGDGPSASRPSTAPPQASGSSGVDAPSPTTAVAPKAGPMVGDVTTGRSGSTAESTGGGTSGGATGDPGSTSAVPPTPVDGSRIVKTASIELAVAHGAVSDTFGRVTALAAGVDGFVSQQQTTEAGGSPSGTITLRVPSAAFEQVLAQVRKLGEVQTATSGGQDVTAEYTDLDARLRSLTDERTQLELVLGAAKDVPDILSVHDRLTNVQTEIEQLQGRKNVLDDQTQLATLTVSVREKGDAPSPVPSEPAGFSKAWHDAAHGFNSGLQAIVAGSGRTAFLLLVGLVVLGLGRAGLGVWRRRQRRTAAVDPASATRPAV